MPLDSFLLVADNESKSLYHQRRRIAGQLNALGMGMGCPLWALNAEFWMSSISIYLYIKSKPKRACSRQTQLPKFYKTSKENAHVEKSPFFFFLLIIKKKKSLLLPSLPPSSLLSSFKMMISPSSFDIVRAKFFPNLVSSFLMNHS